MTTSRLLPALLAAMLGVSASPALAQQAATPPAASWLKMSDAERRAADELAQAYMRFLKAAKIPLHRTQYLTTELAKTGFKPFGPSSAWQPGAKYYLVNRDRALMAVVVGKKPLKAGVRLIGAHLDSPRLDLRLKPLKTVEGFGMLKTQPYGGIKRYQWSNLPLALVGQVARKDGKLVDVSIGMQPNDPVFILPDLAPHVDKEFRGRSVEDVFKGEELSTIAASVPDGSGDLKKAVMGELNKRYGLDEEDFISSELALVPAQEPREVGLDRMLIGSYGQDDGLCSFVGINALQQLKGTPEYTSIVYLVDHEEVGNINTTGVRSRFFVSALERFANRELGREASSEYISTLLENSEAISADVSQAINPNFPGTEDPHNTARLGQGFTVKTMKPGFDATPAFRGRLRRMLADQRISWQTYAYKVDGGGGATIGAQLQELNMDVVDVGAPLLAMHGTFELSSKADLHALNRFFDAYFSAP
ncbi:aminopeptidase 1 [bacterium]|nr:aminopeptidase 1 [bacterium]